MLNYLFVLFNSILLFLVNVLHQYGEPRLTANIPTAMVADHETVLEIKIVKTELTGFATFQMDLPSGFVAREIESSEAVFSIEEGQMIWTWDDLPESEEITLSIGITPSASAIGKHSIAGLFYYLENNEKKSSVLERSEISVQKEGGAEDVQANASSTITENSHAEPAGIITIDKSMSNGEIANEKLINISISKGITKGFARYSDNLMDGYSARAIKTDGSSFSIADGKIKFVWVNVPDKDVLNVSYVLIRKSSAESIELMGEYSYLEHNQSKKVIAPTQNISFSNSVVQQTEVDVKPKEAVEPPKKIEPVVQPVKEEMAKQTEKKQNQPAFAIQIGAFTNSKVSAQTLKRRFKVTEAIRSEFQEGYSKFMIGSLSEYKKAHDKREQTVTKNGVKSAFVVAYYNGKRITVQEALMTLNQKWFK